MDTSHHSGPGVSPVDTTKDKSIEEVKPKCFDISGKLGWITQALSVLFATKLPKFSYDF